MIIPEGYTFYEWDKLSHKDRIAALHEYSKHVSSSITLSAIKSEIEYYQNIQRQIKELNKS